MQLRRFIRLGLVASALFASGPAIANSTDDAVARANRMAYDAAMKCFVVNTYASGERSRVGDLVKAEAYRAKARQAFDLSYTAGATIGLREEQIHRDLDFAQQTELPRLVQDKTYLAETVGTCKALGLM